MKIKVCLCEGVFDRSNPVSPRLCEGVCDRGNPGDRNGNRGLDCFAKPRKDGRGISVFARESATAANQSPFVFARESSTAAIQGSGREQGAGLLRKASQRRTGDKDGNRGLDCFAGPRKDRRGISVFARESATAANQGTKTDRGLDCFAKPRKDREEKTDGEGTELRHREM